MNYCFRINSTTARKVHFDPALQHLQVNNFLKKLIDFYLILHI